MSAGTEPVASKPVPHEVASWRRLVGSLHPLALAAAAILVLIVLLAVMSPFMGTVDPRALAPTQRLKPPSELYWLGTDQFGRDVWSRVVYGARVSLMVGVAVACRNAALPGS